MICPASLRKLSRFRSKFLISKTSTNITKTYSKQIKKPKDDNKHTEKKIEKNSNSQEISNLILKLRDISGLDKKYDNVLVLKWLIKYFDKYTSHKF